MPEIPAFCDSCKTIFVSGFSFENSSNINLVGNRSKCPNCGQMARIPDGLYNFFGDTIELLKGPEITIERLRIFKKILSEISKKKLSQEEAKEVINSEIPELSKLNDFLPKTRIEFYSFVLMLIAAIALMLNQCDGNTKPDINIEQVINYHNENNVTISSSTTNYDNEFKNIGGNDLCPCGSGIKFKHCHGKK